MPPSFFNKLKAREISAKLNVDERHRIIMRASELVLNLENYLSKRDKGGLSTTLADTLNNFLYALRQMANCNIEEGCFEKLTYIELVRLLVPSDMPEIDILKNISEVYKPLKEFLLCYQNEIELAVYMGAVHVEALIYLQKLPELQSAQMSKILGQMTGDMGIGGYSNLSQTDKVIYNNFFMTNRNLSIELNVVTKKLKSLEEFGLPVSKSCLSVYQFPRSVSESVANQPDHQPRQRRLGC